MSPGTCCPGTHTFCLVRGSLAAVQLGPSACQGSRCEPGSSSSVACRCSPVSGWQCLVSTPTRYLLNGVNSGRKRGWHGGQGQNQGIEAAVPRPSLRGWTLCYGVLAKSLESQSRTGEHWLTAACRLSEALPGVSSAFCLHQNKRLPMALRFPVDIAFWIQKALAVSHLPEDVQCLDSNRGKRGNSGLGGAGCTPLV